MVCFDVDKCVAAVAKKAIIEPEPHTLKEGSTCVVRWSDNCRYEAVVLATADNYAQAKKQEKVLARKQLTPPPSQPPAKKQKTTKKAKPRQKRSSPDKFEIEVGSPPPQLGPQRNEEL